jgi:HNH endonuclease
MSTCYYCGVTIDDTNRSREHVIPNGLGGRLVSSDLLCSKHNNETGAAIDEAITNQLGNELSLIEAALPTSPSDLKLVLFTEDGDKNNYVGEDIKSESVFTIPLGLLTGNKEEKDVVLKGEYTDLIKRARRILEQLAKKYPSIDPEKLLTHNVRKTEVMPGIQYPSNYERLSKDKRIGEEVKKQITPSTSAVGGWPFFRSVIKIALNFYLSQGGDKTYVEEAIRTVRSDTPPARKIADFYYERAITESETQALEVSHILHLRGDCKNRVLYCYVELFNAHNSIVLLNTVYDGPEIDLTYRYNFISNSVSNDKIILPVETANDIDSYIRSGKSRKEEHERRVHTMKANVVELLRRKGVVQ